MNIGSYNGTPTLTWFLGEELDMADLKNRFAREKKMYLKCITKALHNDEVKHYFFNHLAKAAFVFDEQLDLKVDEEIDMAEYRLCRGIAEEYS